MNFNPRAIRKIDAPLYLGMKRGMFEKHIRPTLQEVSIGGGKFYDRLDLDGCFEEYKRCSKRHSKLGGNMLWRENEHQDSTLERVPGTLTKKYKAKDFAKALELVHSKKQKNF